ncbi:hypothetical protein V6Z11_D11G237400 [Gossypium hirsutum]
MFLAFHFLKQVLCCRKRSVEGDYAKATFESEPFVYFCIMHGNFGRWCINLFCNKLL